MEYICPRCHYSTHHKGHFIRHIHNKRPCPSTYGDIPLATIRSEYSTEGLKTYHCEHCTKCFRTRSGLAYHRPICLEAIETPKEPPCSDKQKSGMMYYYQDAQIHELTEEVKKLKNMVSHMHTTNAVQHNAHAQIINHGDIQALDNSHHQHLHFHLNSFGNESKEHISREFAVECFKKGAYGILDMLDKIYFDNNTPENHNVKIRSLKNMLVEVFKDPHWEVRGFHDTVDGMISMSRNEIIKDISSKDIMADEELMYTLQNIMNPPSNRVKNIKEHTKARLVQRRENTNTQTSITHMIGSDDNVTIQGFVTNPGVGAGAGVVSAMNG